MTLAEALNDFQSYICRNLISTPTKIIKSGKATIVFWSDGTKTVVKRMDGDGDDPYDAFNAALAKKLYGSSNAVKKIVDKTETIIKEKKKIEYEIPIDYSRSPVYTQRSVIFRNNNEKEDK